ncbi:MAG: glycosyltransferase [Patescibacteria group bacterium]
MFKAITSTCKYLDVEWIILLGLLNKDSRDLFHDFPHATIYDWIDSHTVASILSKSDLVITRGSATTLAEIDLFKKRKIIVPYPWSSQNHQHHNAMWYKENRNDIVIDDGELMDNLLKTVTETLTRDTIEKKMERADTFLR